MRRRTANGIDGWLLAYLLGSIPIMAICSIGLSGWFFDYPIGLMAAIFCALAIPLGLIATRSPRAPRWNVAVLWTMAVLMTLRAASVLFVPVGGDEQPPPQDELLAVAKTLAGIVALFVAWAAAWTHFFRRAERV